MKQMVKSMIHPWKKWFNHRILRSTGQVNIQVLQVRWQAWSQMALKCSQKVIQVLWLFCNYSQLFSTVAIICYLLQWPPNLELRKAKWRVRVVIFLHHLEDPPGQSKGRFLNIMSMRMYVPHAIVYKFPQEKKIHENLALPMIVRAVAVVQYLLVLAHRIRSIKEWQIFYVIMQIEKKTEVGVACRPVFAFP